MLLAQLPRKSWLRTNDGIGPQQLGAGRSVVDVVQTHQRVAQQSARDVSCTSRSFSASVPAFSIAPSGSSAASVHRCAAPAQ